MAEEFTVFWCGSYKDFYLCIPPYKPTEPSSREEPADDPYEPVQYRSRAPIREHLLELLGQRPLWLSTELRKASGMDKSAYFNLIRDMHLNGLVERSTGIVALKRKDAA